MSILVIEVLNSNTNPILKGLEDAGLIAIENDFNVKKKRHSVMELKGLGVEIWKDESVDDYLRKERESWSF